MEQKAFIFDIKRDCSEDGPGIRTTIFFKGCPLSCVWCQNPEGKDKKADLMFTKSTCHANQCDAPCVSACDEDCLTRVNDKVVIDRNKCTVCGKCTEVCHSSSLNLSGYWINLDDLMYRILIDKPFFKSSGGGVTLSGGEVTAQMRFVHQLLKTLKQEGIHTAIETSGFFNYDKFSKQILPWVDLIYFDLKLIDDKDSQIYTGQSNQLILENFRKLIQLESVPVIPRVPLVPGVTSTTENLRGIAEFLQDLGINAATLLPYNPLWTDKLDKLGKTPQYYRATFMTAAEKEQSIRDFKSVNEKIIS